MSEEMISCKICGNKAYLEDLMDLLQFDGNRIFSEDGRVPKCPMCGAKSWDWGKNELQIKRNVK